MSNTKELSDFYMWMVENDYDHNIRARVEKKAEIYLNAQKEGQTLPLDNVSVSCCSKNRWEVREDGNRYCVKCGENKTNN